MHSLTNEQQTLLNETYQHFSKNGVALGEKDQERLREINQQLSQLSIKFGKNVLTDSNAYQLLIDKEEDLSGLPESLVKNASILAEKNGHKGKWAFNLDFPSYLPFVKYADNRELRKEISIAYKKRAANDNENNNLCECT